MALTLEASELLASLLELFVYGFYLNLCIGSVFVLVQRRRHGDRTWFQCLNLVLTSGTAILFLAITAHLVLTIIRLYTTFVDQHVPPNQAFAILTEPIQVARMALTLFIILVFDALLIYRVYMICDNMFMLAPLLVLLSADFAVSVVIVHGMAMERKDIFSFWAKWFTTIMLLSFSLNALAVVFIAYKVFQRNRAFPQRTFTDSSRVLLIVIEGGFLYWLTTITNLGTIRAHSAASCITLDITAPIVGASLALMCLRIKQGHGTSTARASALPPFPSGAGTAIPLQIEVHQERSMSTSAAERSFGRNMPKGKDSPLGEEWA